MKMRAVYSIIEVNDEVRISIGHEDLQKMIYSLNPWDYRNDSLLGFLKQMKKDIEPS